ncbi:hypothetical protein HPB48_022264 [Haemaphysalis longicornis]|uniref:Uncharacterized protein n=1 Tax=Haemaphysalis longicornis TaxID=44386 RepID=A0A9J6GC89_HAELO|nr:hypothetical protein HPB48_022264 [Haemaphysalis longicornis]
MSGKEPPIRGIPGLHCPSLSSSLPHAGMQSRASYLVRPAQYSHVAPVLWIVLLLLQNRLSATLRRLILLVAGALQPVYTCCKTVRSGDPACMSSG